VTFSRIESYYAEVARELRLGKVPPHPKRRPSLVLMPVTTVNLVTQRGLSAALSLGDRVQAIDVACDEEDRERIMEQWQRWNPGVELKVLISPDRAFVRSTVEYVESLAHTHLQVTVLIVEIEPRRRRHAVLHNQRGVLLAAVLSARTNAIVARLPFRLHE
jgi:hypothetical protein